jgi:hypothetical protein
MPNLSSFYSYSPDGDVKHIELKVGLIVERPIQKSVIEYLQNNYTDEQCESIRWLKGATRFSAKQASLIVKGKSKKYCSFNANDILNNDKEVVKS